MTKYASRSGKEKGVISYSIENDRVILNYKSRNGGISSMLYSYDISGIKHLENIKKFALSSKNLNTYIQKNRIHCKRVTQ